MYAACDLQKGKYACPKPGRQKLDFFYKATKDTKKDQITAKNGYGFKSIHDSDI